MSRYIDIDDDRNCFIGMSGEYENYNIDPDVLVESIDLVRCKDCKWYHGIGCAIKIVDESDEPTDNDYCSYGERAEK